MGLSYGLAPLFCCVDKPYLHAILFRLAHGHIIGLYMCPLTIKIKEKEKKPTMLKKFQRTKEDFTCEKCGFVVKGSGYTNHCPHCLWSKHVDINPGDRQETCHGLMEPMSVELKGGEYTILHRCIVCGFEKRNKTAKDDDFDVIVQLSTRPIRH